MFASSPNSKRPLVLIVEDDPHSLAFLESSLEEADIECLSAKGFQQAQRIVERVGIEQINAVLTDYRMPGGSGLDLLSWIRERDPSMAVAIVTGQGQKAVVQAALAKGAYDFLDKPVTFQMLAEVTRKAIAETSRRRRSVADRRGLEDLERVDQSLNERIPETLESRIDLIYRPLHQIGGDFLLTHDCGNGRTIMMVGDVSGHDLRSGYVSTYFQGLFRGYMESSASVESTVNLFNRALLRDGWASSLEGTPISVSIAIVEDDLSCDFIKHWNFGLAPCHVVTQAGGAYRAPFGNFPLGWVDSVQLEPAIISRPRNAFLYLFTDGLLEYADDLEINPFSLFYKMKNAANPFADLPVEPSDDILVLRFLLNPTMHSQLTLETILNEHYAGTEIDHIDHLQSVWRRSINFALDDILGDRLYDLLICIREGMINAFVHGCNRAPDKFAHLTISVDSAKENLRVQIDDPGRGHQFDLKKRLEELQTQTGDHLGLGIIQHLSDDFAIDNNGTTLVFDFQIKPEAE